MLVTVEQERIYESKHRACRVRGGAIQRRNDAHEKQGLSSSAVCNDITATGVLYGHGALSHGLEIGVCDCNVPKAQPEVLNRPTWWPLSLPGRHPLEQLVQRVHQQTWFDKRPGQEGREKSRIDVLQSQRRGKHGACEREGRKQ